MCVENYCLQAHLTVYWAYQVQQPYRCTFQPDHCISELINQCINHCNRIYPTIVFLRANASYSSFFLTASTKNTRPTAIITKENIHTHHSALVQKNRCWAPTIHQRTQDEDVLFASKGGCWGRYVFFFLLYHPYAIACV